MQSFNPSFTTIDYHLTLKKQPDFNQLLRVLKGEKPDRPVLFELFLNDDLYSQLADSSQYDLADEIQMLRHQIAAYCNAGYDYVTMHATANFKFTSKREKKNGDSTVSLNKGWVISDQASFVAYDWPKPLQADYSRLDKIKAYLPDGMKAIVYGPGGVLENVIELTGYENLCLMLSDDPELVQALFEAVGSRLVDYYRLSSRYDAVGALVSNDDWGFNSQTMLSVADMRQYVFPWHKKIVDVIHAAGKPAILHSCGNLDLVMDDIIDELNYDAKHSYEDKIQPVEQAYRQYSDRIAIMGGIDMDFLCRAEPAEIYQRAANLLAITKEKGGYALGSGNSIPTYVPIENYLAMIAAAHFYE